MTTMSYLVNLNSANPDVDLDSAMRAALSRLAAALDPAGHHRFAIELLDPAGELLDSYLYDPAEGRTCPNGVEGCDHDTCPDGFHYGTDLPCSCTPNCILREDAQGGPE